MNARDAIVEKILASKFSMGLKWPGIAQQMELPTAKITAACLGQMSLSSDDVDKLDEVLHLGLSDTEKAILNSPPDRGSLKTIIPTDPTVYRFYEFLLIYGSTLKQLISEEFGDGVMSTTDFDLEVEKIEQPGGDRVQVKMSGKFMPFTMK